MSAGRRWTALAACALAALTAATLIHIFATPEPQDSFAYDQQAYLSLARHPFVQTPAVYAPASWRVLPPLAARAISLLTGVGVDRAFLILTFACDAVVPLVAFAFFDALGISTGVALVAAAIAGLSPTMLAYTAWDVVRVDPLSLVLLFVISHAVVRRRRWAMVAALIALALTKETVIIGLFFALAWSVCFDRAGITAAIGSLAVSVALRFVVLPRVMPPTFRFDNLFALKGMIRDELTVRYAARRLLLASATAWNLMLPFAAVWIVDTIRERRTQVLLLTILIAESQILFASDTQRVVAAAYPYVLACTAFALDRLDRRPRILASAALVAAQIPWLCENGRVRHFEWLRGVEIALVIVTAALVSWRMWTRAQTPGAA